MGMENIFGQMEKSIKENGKKIYLKDKELLKIKKIKYPSLLNIKMGILMLNNNCLFNILY
jgi:hypothetical protein